MQRMRRRRRPDRARFLEQMTMIEMLVSELHMGDDSDEASMTDEGDSFEVPLDWDYEFRYSEHSEFEYNYGWD